MKKQFIRENIAGLQIILDITEDGRRTPIYHRKHKWLKNIVRTLITKKMKRKYNNGGEIKKKIADLQKLINNPKTDAKFIPLYKKGIDKLQAQLETIEPQEVEVETQMPKPRVEKTAPKVAKTTKPKAIEKVAKV
jgi:hypothetical protein